MIFVSLSCAFRYVVSSSRIHRFALAEKDLHHSVYNEALDESASNDQVGGDCCQILWLDKATAHAVMSGHITVPATRSSGPAGSAPCSSGAAGHALKSVMGTSWDLHSPLLMQGCKLCSLEGWGC